MPACRDAAYLGATGDRSSEMRVVCLVTPTVFIGDLDLLGNPFDELCFSTTCNETTAESTVIQKKVLDAAAACVS